VGLLVIGAGGHAKVVIDTAQAAGLQVSGVIGGDGDPAEILGVPVSRDRSGVEADSFVVAIGDNAIRAAAFAQYLETGLTPATVVHPSAVVARTVTVAAGTVIASGVVVNVDTRIGANVILNTGCRVDHDCIIGDHAHVGPSATLCGGVRVGEGVLIGVGGCAIPCVSVGEWSVVGAGSAVVADVPPHSTWGGVPARPLGDGKKRA